MHSLIFQKDKATLSYVEHISMQVIAILTTMMIQNKSREVRKRQPAAKGAH